MSTCALVQEHIHNLPLHERAQIVRYATARFNNLEKGRAVQVHVDDATRPSAEEKGTGEDSPTHQCAQGGRIAFSLRFFHYNALGEHSHSFGGPSAAGTETFLPLRLLPLFNCTGGGPA